MTLPIDYALLALYFPVVWAAAWYDHRCREIPPWLIVPPFYAALMYFVWRLGTVTATGHAPNYPLAVAITASMMIVLYASAVLRFRGTHLIGGADARVLITIGALIPAVSVGSIGAIPTLPLILALTLGLIHLFPQIDSRVRADWKKRGIPGLIPVCAGHLLLLLIITLW